MHISIIPSFIICTVAFGLVLASTFSSEWLLIFQEHELFGTVGLFQVCTDKECILAGEYRLLRVD